ncbi:MAG TPA: aquaporin [Candidatus Saccharimonadaceae bacterium]|nr:aquaporin [Candidatus Saccharimonadaceae bacterium]
MATKAGTTTKKKAPARKTSATKTTRKSVSSAPKARANSLVSHVQQSVRSMALWRSLGAEFIGTFLLASVVIAGQGQPIFVLFALVGIILLVGSVSGAHVNPAITIGALVTRRIGWFRALGYIIVQVLGAALAFVTLSAFLNGAAPVGEEAALFGQAAPALFAASEAAAYAGKEWYIFFAELLGAGLLAFAMARVLSETKDRVAAAFTGGLGIFIALMVAISAVSYVGVSTAAINPAVAVALEAYSWETLWPFAIYAIAPVIGAIVGFIVHDVIVRGSVK